MTPCDYFVLIMTPLVLIFFGRAHAAEGRAMRALERQVSERQRLSDRRRM